MDIRDWLQNYGKYNLEIAIEENKGEKETPRQKRLKEEKAILELIIESLPAEEKQMVIGRYIEKKSYDKLAHEMGYAKATLFERDKKLVKKLLGLLNIPTEQKPNKIHTKPNENRTKTERKPNKA